MKDHTIESITAGESWACRFRVQTFVDAQGQPVDTRNLQIGEAVKDAEPGWYEGVGVVQVRDRNHKLVELWDRDLDRTWVVGWDDCWDIDTVEWLDAAHTD